MALILAHTLWIHFQKCSPYIWHFFVFSLVYKSFTTATTSDSFSDFKFTIEPEDVIGIRDQPLLLNCSAKYNNEVPAMLWARDGVELSVDEDERREILSNGSLYVDSVVHTKSHKPDEGIYQCKATVDSLGTIVSRKAKLQIAYLSKSFDVEPSNLEVYLGDTAIFQCRMDGAPKPTVRWFKDSTELYTDSQNYKLHLDGTLEITNVHFDDFARYQCKVENVDKARDSEEAVLVQSSDISSYNAAPHFILRPSDQVSLEGSTIELLCAANGRDDSGNPPKVTWLKDGVTIELDDEESRYSMMGHGSLRILNALEGDTGMYTCRATNNEDAVDADASVTVHVAPRFQRRPANTVAKVSTDVEFACDVYGFPQPSIQWMKNGEVIINSNYFQISDVGRSLKILGLVSEDQGVYQCLAENLVGNVQASAQLRVLQSDSQDDAGGAALPSAPTHVMAVITDIRFVTLSWRQPEVAGTSLVATYTVYWTEEGSDRHRMLNTSAVEANIQGLEPSTTYTFRIIAINQAGAGPAAVERITTKNAVNVPSPPQNLQAVTLSSTSIQITWEQPVQTTANIAHYVLSYYEAGETDEHKMEVEGLSYNLTGLDEFVLYNFYVVAYNDIGAGQATEEVMARTFSDVPSSPPQNVSVESVSSTAVVLRWQPPASRDRNGMITGYKIRYKKDGDRKGNAVTEDANQRSYALNDLERGTSYQIRIQALNVNGSGPPTDWITAMTYVYDLDETTVPGQPVSLEVRPMIDSVVVGWIPPNERDIRVRGYVLGYGKGVPDIYTQVLDDNQRFYTIQGLDAGSEYVISLRAYNNKGEGRPKLATTKTRTDEPVEPQTPMTPPVGLKAISLSSTAIILTWTDNSLGRNQRVTDNRFYTVRYAPSSNSPKYKYINCSELNQHIDDLRPNVQYDFCVKVIKGRRESTWSLSAYNKTFEHVPTSAPRDLTPVAVEDYPTWVSLSWQPPRQPNGQITGYLVLYTTDASLRDREWVVEGIARGDKLSTIIRDLTPETTYYFKVQARNNKGMGPMSPTVIFRTPKGDGTGGGRVQVPNDFGGNQPNDDTRYNNNKNDFDLDKYYTDRKETQTERDTTKESSGIPPLVLYISLAAIGCVTLVAVLVVTIIMCKRKQSDRKRGYQAAKANKTNNLITPKPPDLWIHHEQGELKGMDKNRGPEEIEEMKPLNQDYSGDRSYDDRYHRTPHRSKPIMISVDQPPPPRQPIATAIPNGHVIDGVPPMRPLYPRTQYSTQYTSAPRVHAGDFSPPCSEDSYSTATVERRKPKLNHDALKPHGSTSMLTGRLYSEFGHYYSEPYRVYYDPFRGRIPDFSIKPQGSTSPYKKPNPPVSSATSPPPVMASPRPPLPPVTTKPPPDVTLRSDTESDLPKSFSTEELTAEMANLEGLMKDLNYITQQDFEC